MRVYGLEGKSGTGKSYHAMEVCRKYKIRGIIDDGLFIYDSAIYAGHSAKRDGNVITAIKTAIFNDPEERKSVAEAIRNISPESILVLGTSEGMVEKICQRLELGQPDVMLHIEDIASSEEIENALRQRRQKGKHVIPVPAIEIKSQFSGYFLRPLLGRLKTKNGRSQRVNDKTVVRPAYSYLGEFTVSDKAVLQLVKHSAVESSGVAEVRKCGLKNRKDGVLLIIEAVFYLDRNLKKNILMLQQSAADNVESMTAFNILGVNVIVKGLRI